MSIFVVPQKLKDVYLLFKAESFLISVDRHLRLELLEGVVSFHSGQFEISKKMLTSAQAKYLQVSLSCIK